MSDIPRAPTPGEMSEHLQSFFSFERMVLFAVLHIALTLSSVALAFIGQIPVLALILWLGGSLVLLGPFAVSGDWSDRA